MSIVEVPTSSSGSIVSCQDDINEIVYIGSTDSEENVEDNLPEVKLKCFPSYGSAIKKNQMVTKWLQNAEDPPKNPSFLSQVSTICGESTKIHKDGNHIAASSTLNDCLTHRFDELFVDKKKGKGEIKYYLLQVCIFKVHFE